MREKTGRIAKKVYAWKLFQKFGARVNEYDQDRDGERVLDMLRYDRAFINDGMPGVVLTFDFKMLDGGALKGGVTLGRWHSFSLHLSALAPAPEAEALTLERVLRDDEAWYTMQHPSTREHGKDYAALKKYTLREYLAGADEQRI